MGCNDPKEKIYPPVPPVPSWLEPATADRLGGVKIGDGISVTEDGTISASGGGGGNMIVTITRNDTEYTADKTLTEIQAAVANGVIPVAYNESNKLYVPMVYCDYNCRFTGFSDVMSGGAEIIDIRINSDDSVTVDYPTIGDY